MTTCQSSITFPSNSRADDLTFVCQFEECHASPHVFAGNIHDQYYTLTWVDTQTALDEIESLQEQIGILNGYVP